jgi:hypothetical protein
LTEARQRRQQEQQQQRHQQQQRVEETSTSDGEGGYVSESELSAERVSSDAAAADASGGAASEVSLELSGGAGEPLSESSGEDLPRRLVADPAAELALVRSMPQLVACLRFLAVFGRVPGVRLTRSFSAAELEDALVSSRGGAGSLLASLHADLLALSAPGGARPAEGLFAAALMQRLEARRVEDAGISLPLGEEAAAYALLPAVSR